MRDFFRAYSVHLTLCTLFDSTLTYILYIRLHIAFDLYSTPCSKPCEVGRDSTVTMATKNSHWKYLSIFILEQYNTHGCCSLQRTRIDIMLLFLVTLLHFQRNLKVKTYVF